MNTTRREEEVRKACMCVGCEKPVINGARGWGQSEPSASRRRTGDRSRNRQAPATGGFLNCSVPEML